MEEAHYYPYGLPMAGMGDAALNATPNRRKYQTNEYITDGGLKWMDFHARQYDPQLGRFMNVDPLAALGQQSLSPYTGMNNRPSSVVDPGGALGYQYFDMGGLFRPAPYVGPPPGFARSTLNWIFNGVLSDPATGGTILNALFPHGAASIVLNATSNSAPIS